MSEIDTAKKRVVDLPPPCCEHCQRQISFQPLVEQAIEQAQLKSSTADALRLMLKGLSNKEIAEVLATSEKTIKGRFAVIFEKFGVSGRTELVHLLFPS